MTGRMRIQIPGREPYTVQSVASNEEHLGNLVAEGEMRYEEYWPELVRLYREQGRANERRVAEARRERERAAYAAGWVERWLAW